MSTFAEMIANDLTDAGIIGDWPAVVDITYNLSGAKAFTVSNAGIVDTTGQGNTTATFQGVYHPTPDGYLGPNGMVVEGAGFIIWVQANELPLAHLNMAVLYQGKYYQSTSVLNNAAGTTWEILCERVQ